MNASFSRHVADQAPNPSGARPLRMSIPKTRASLSMACKSPGGVDERSICGGRRSQQSYGAATQGTGEVVQNLALPEADNKILQFDDRRSWRSGRLVHSSLLPPPLWIAVLICNKSRVIASLPDELPCFPKTSAEEMRRRAPSSAKLPSVKPMKPVSLATTMPIGLAISIKIKPGAVFACNAAIDCRCLRRECARRFDLFPRADRQPARCCDRRSPKNSYNHRLGQQAPERRRMSQSYFPTGGREWPAKAWRCPGLRADNYRIG